MILKILTIGHYGSVSTIGKISMQPAVFPKNFPHPRRIDTLRDRMLTWVLFQYHPRCLWLRGDIRLFSIYAWLPRGDEEI